MVLASLPVTALHFTNSDRTLLGGLGPSVIVFERHDVESAMEFRSSSQVLRASEKILGFADIQLDQAGFWVLVWSSESVCLFDIESSNVVMLLQTPPDRIYQTKWLPESGLLVVAFGHSQVHIYKVYVSPSGRHRTVRLDAYSRFRCSEAELTWNTHILSVPTDGVQLAAGTSFGNIILWTAKTIAPSDAAVVQIVPPDQVLSGHRGPVFQLAWSRDGQYLISVGDDWTVRLWTTGDDKRWKELACSFGHEGRIWNCIAVPSLDNSQLTIVSSSEDRTCRVWTYEYDQLECKEVLAGHVGKGVRAIAVTEASIIGARRVASGGDDGGLRIHELDTSEITTFVDFPKDEVRGNQPEAIRAMLFMDEDQILATTDTGRLTRISFRNSEARRFQTLWKSAGTFAFAQNSLTACGDDSVVAGDSESCLSVFSGIAGDQPVRVRRWKAVDTGMALVIHIPAETEALVSACSGRVFHWDWSGHGDEDGATLKGVYATPHRQPALAIVGCRRLGFVVFCDKVGRILLFPYARDNPEQVIAPVHSLRPHFDRITHIRLEESDGSRILGRIFTGDCNGVYNSTIVCLESEGLRLHPESSMQRNGPLEHIDCSMTISDKVILFGFAASKFLIWDQTDSHQIVKADCGGWRRPHCTALVSSGTSSQETAWFASWRKSTLQVTSAAIPRHQVLIRSLHGMRINCCQTILSPRCNGGEVLVITGAEDTNVVVSSFSASGGGFGERQTLEGHEAGVAAVAITRSLQDPVIFSGAGQGELRAWKQSGGGRWGLHRRSRPKFRKAQSGNQAVARFTTLGLLEKEGQVWLVFGSSRGEIGACHFDEAQASVDLEVCWREELHQGMVRCLSVVASEYIVSGDSLGVVAVSHAGGNPGAPATVAASFTAHQLAVNCMFCWTDPSDGRLWVLSGGDDESVALSCVSLNSPVAAQTVSRVHCHCAAIAGVWAAPVSSTPRYAMSAGLDQKVCVYEISSTGLRLSHAQPIDVPDAAALVVTDAESSRHVFVVGVGLQSLSLDQILHPNKHSRSD